MLAVVAIWETLSPWRAPRDSRPWRWSVNLGLMLVSTVLLRVAIPIGAMAVAHKAHTESWGLLNWVHLPSWLAIATALIALDLVIYTQHLISHKIPLLWRLHKVHHSDRDYDTTTAIRFHPLEIVMSLGVKFAAVIALGAPVLSVLLFEIVLNAAAMFNHANASLPASVDRALRHFLVTPDMHRIHHSTVVEETNSNYGFSLPWWDRIFKTYCPVGKKGVDGLEIGLAEYQEPRLNLAQVLALPFGKTTSTATAKTE